MAVRSVVTKPDGKGGTWVCHWHDDQTADVWHREPGRAAYCLIYRQVMWKVRAEMAERGITEDGWKPD